MKYKSTLLAVTVFALTSDAQASFSNEIFALMNSNPSSLKALSQSAKSDSKTVQQVITDVGLDSNTVSAIDNKLAGAGTVVQRIDAVNTSLGGGAVNTNDKLTAINTSLGGVAVDTTGKITAANLLIEAANPANTLTQKITAVNTSLGTGQMNGAGAVIPDALLKVAAIKGKTNAAQADLTADVNALLTAFANFFTAKDGVARPGGANYGAFAANLKNPNTITLQDVVAALNGGEF